MTALTHILPRERVVASDFKPGAFGLSVISGRIGDAVAWGQKHLAGDDGPFTHAWMILDNNEVIEAEPGGARIRPIGEYLDHDEILVCDQPVQTKLAELKAIHQETGVTEELTDATAFYDYLEGLIREQFVSVAREFDKAPYGYLQYLAIGLAARGIRPAWLRKLIGNKRVICSQLVDRVAQVIGVEFFDDKRWEGEVTPGDLYRYATTA